MRARRALEPRRPLQRRCLRKASRERSWLVDTTRPYRSPTPSNGADKANRAGSRQQGLEAARRPRRRTQTAGRRSSGRRSPCDARLKIQLALQRKRAGHPRPALQAPNTKNAEVARTPIAHRTVPDAGTRRRRGDSSARGSCPSRGGLDSQAEDCPGWCDS